MKFFFAVVLYFICICSVCNAQTYNASSDYKIWGTVSIGKGDNSPTAPDAIAEFGGASTSKAIILPRIPDSALITRPVDGMFAYLLQKKSPAYYSDGKWKFVSDFNVVHDSAYYNPANGTFTYHKTDGSTFTVNTGLVDSLLNRYTKFQANSNFIQASPTVPQSAGFSLTGSGTFYNSSSTFDPVNNSSILIQNTSGVSTGTASIALRGGNYVGTSWIASQTTGTGPGKTASLAFGNNATTAMTLTNSVAQFNGMVRADRGIISTTLGVNATPYGIYNLSVGGGIESRGATSGLQIFDRYFEASLFGASNTWRLIADSAYIALFNTNPLMGISEAKPFMITTNTSYSGLYSVGINDPGLSATSTALSVRGGDVRIWGRNNNASLMFDADVYTNAATIQALDHSGSIYKTLRLNPYGGDVVIDKLFTKGLNVKTGSGDDRIGMVVFPVGTTVMTVSTSAITANSIVLLSVKDYTTPDIAVTLSYNTIVPGTSFKISFPKISTATGTVGWTIVEPTNPF